MRSPDHLPEAIFIKFDKRHGKLTEYGHPLFLQMTIESQQSSFSGKGKTIVDSAIKRDLTFAFKNIRRQEKNDNTKSVYREGSIPSESRKA